MLLQIFFPTKVFITQATILMCFYKKSFPMKAFITQDKIPDPVSIVCVQNCSLCTALKHYIFCTEAIVYIIYSNIYIDIYRNNPQFMPSSVFQVLQLRCPTYFSIQISQCTSKDALQVDGCTGGRLIVTLLIYLQLPLN